LPSLRGQGCMHEPRSMTD